MPPRLNKRQQRELEELSALGGASAPSQEPDEDPVGKGKPGVGFSTHLLAEENVDDDEVQEEEGPSAAAKSRKKKKGKKKVDAPSTPAALPAKNEKKAAKRAKAKEKKADDDELEQALAELSLKYSSVQSPSSSTSTGATSRPLLPNALSALLATSLPHLDPAAEMRKFFGSKVVRTSTSTSGPSSLGARKRAGATQKSHLTRPQPTWWSASQREGLAIRALEQEEVNQKAARHGWSTLGTDGERWWTVDYSQRYKSMTKLFIQAVMSGHPDALWDVQRKLPWHGDNLLQLAEVYRHREEYAQAVDFVDRALFTYERAFIGAFTFTSGTSRLDFDHVENRPFFLAVHRQIADLQRRGCVRTAFEFARLLYALDPWADPHGALFHLDLLAIKGGMGSWLVEVYDYFEALRARKQTGGRMDPSVLPGWGYARALAMRINEGDADPHEKSTQALGEAMRSFPELVPLLADKIDVSLTHHIRGHQSFRVLTDAGSLSPASAVLHALAHMYASHSSAPWKEPAYAAWFLSTALSTFPPSLSSSQLPTTERRTAALSLLASLETQRTLARHIVVLEGTHRRLLAFLPRGYGQGAGLACDPLPPSTAVSTYDTAYFEGVEDVLGARVRGRGAAGGVEDDERLLAMAIPDEDIRARVAQVLHGLRGQFPGGLRDMMDRLGPEAVEDVLGQVQGMIMAQDEAQGGGEFGMPGAFALVGEAGAGGVPAHEPMPQPAPVPAPAAVPQQQGDVGEASDVEDEDEEERVETSAIQRVLRNVLGRFWGGAAAAGDDTSEDEGEDEGQEGQDSDGVD